MGNFLQRMSLSHILATYAIHQLQANACMSISPLHYNNERGSPHAHLHMALLLFTLHPQQHLRHSRRIQLGIGTGNDE